MNIELFSHSQSSVSSAGWVQVRFLDLGLGTPGGSPYIISIIVHKSKKWYQIHISKISDISCIDHTSHFIHYSTQYKGLESSLFLHIDRDFYRQRIKQLKLDFRNEAILFDCYFDSSIYLPKQ